MSIPNRIGLADIQNMSPAQLAQLAGEDLAYLKEACDQTLSQAKALAERLDQGLSAKYAERAAAMRYEAGKDTGTVRFDDAGVTVVADLAKRVDWDQDILAAIARSIAANGDDPADFIETSLKISERKYQAMPEAWRKGFEPARSLRPGKPKFRFEAKEGSQ